MVRFELLHPQMTQAMLGFIPAFLSEHDPRSAREQIDENYQHGGGWRPLKGWVFLPATGVIKYPGDEALMPLASVTLRDERIYYYPHSWVAIVGPDGAYEVARLD